jgi:arsenite-transporting ATPase
LQLADAGRRTLIVSTDPASNLDDVFGVRAGGTPTEVPGAPLLRVMNIDPVAAAATYRERMVSPYRGVLPDSAIRGMEEQFSGACTVEIAAFNEFTALLADARVQADFDHIVFDTAPTGHTLRLLSLPTAWSGFLTTSSSGASCLGPLAGLEQHRTQYQATVAALADAQRTTVVLVSRAEASALREAAGGRRAGGVRHHAPATGDQRRASGCAPPDEQARDGDSVATSWADRQRRALGEVPVALASLPRTLVPLVAREMAGLETLRALASMRWPDEESTGSLGSEMSPSRTPTSEHDDGGDALRDALRGFASFDDLVDTLSATGHGVVMTMGKGRRGKTTLAAQVAISLAVHLSTDRDVATRWATMPLRPLSRIDPVSNGALPARCWSRGGVGCSHGGLLPDERALLPRPALASGRDPSFTSRARLPRRRTAVLDAHRTHAAPARCGESYHREVARTAGSHVLDAVRAPPRLRDPRSRGCCW